MALALTQVSCARVEIKDETLYFPLGSKNGAVVEHTLDTDQALLDQDQWSDVLDAGPIVCMSGDAYGDLKKAYETLCSDMPSACTYDVQQTMTNFFSRTEDAIKIQKRNSEK